MTSKIPSSAIRLIRTKERSGQLAGNMNFDDTRHSTVTQSNPGSPRTSPIALGVLEPAALGGQDFSLCAVVTPAIRRYSIGQMILVCYRLIQFALFVLKVSGRDYLSPINELAGGYHHENNPGQRSGVIQKVRHYGRNQTPTSQR